MNQASFRIKRHAVVSACLVMSSLLLNVPDAVGQQKGQRVPENFNIVSIRVTNITVQDGGLFAEGFAGSAPFSQVPVKISTPGGMTSSSLQGAACPILNLELGPIDVNLLGLRVQTSPICLEVTAFEGGGLLGDLLCSVAQLLQGDASTGDVLGVLQTNGDLTRFLEGLENLFNEALEEVTANDVAGRQTGSMAASCTVLDLSLGPIQLNLLGLQVVLDNCEGGPVTVTITAIRGGGLLGDLLCSLSNLLQGPAGNAPARQAVLWQITRVIAALPPQ